MWSNVQHRSSISQSHPESVAVGLEHVQELAQSLLIVSARSLVDYYDCVYVFCT